MSEILIQNIIFIFLIYLNLDNEGLNENSKNYIFQFVTNFFEKVLQSYQKNLKEIIEKEAINISYEILNIQSIVNQNYQGNLNIKEQANQKIIFKKEYAILFDKMKNIAECYCIRNSIRFIWKPINTILKSVLELTYQKFINENNEVMKLFQEYANKSYDKIDEGLKNLK